MPFLRSQTREKKPRTPPHVMKGDPAKSLAPITVRITADVKPKPIVAEIQVSSNEQLLLSFDTPRENNTKHLKSPLFRCLHQVLQCLQLYLQRLCWRGSRASHFLQSRFDVFMRAFYLACWKCARIIIIVLLAASCAACTSYTTPGHDHQCGRD